MEANPYFSCSITLHLACQVCAAVIGDPTTAPSSLGRGPGVSLAVGLAGTIIRHIPRVSLSRRPIWDDHSSLPDAQSNRCGDRIVLTGGVVGDDVVGGGGSGGAGNSDRGGGDVGWSNISSHHRFQTQLKGNTDMGKSLLFSALVFVFPFIAFSIDSTNSSCPIDLSYVETFPWDPSSCHEQDENNCCQTLLSLFGMGLAQHLKDTSMFQLPNAVASSSCLSNFQTRLAALSIQPSLVPLCFQNSTQFVVNASSCAAIVTTQDWTEKVGPVTPLDTSCKGDLTGLTSDFGPKDARTALCIFGLPLAGSATDTKSDHLSQKSILKLVFAFLGALMGVLVFIGLIMLYRKWDKKKQQNALHEEFVSNVKARVLPNTGATWFRVADLERATNGFSQRNFIGQGAYGVVYKGTFSDGSVVAVKQTLDLDSKGDEEFSNEVEIISKIRHRNLLPLRGCCVASDNSKDWAWMHVKSGHVEEVFDESIREEGPKGVMERFVLVGILCAHVMVAFRPTIAEALRMLEGDIDIPTLPDRPLPLSHESYRSSLQFSISTSDRSRYSSCTSTM
ncbi:hypothetical protein L1049_026545 [Liquidambar formosana]|uniref:non-specific serine/threonine protein kinase n=1 Tax=Liquidambar formosana TaxID=63359 RepID=A0AAP0R5J2_LIQFO